MITDPIKSEAHDQAPPNSFALRISLYDNGAAELTPSAQLHSGASHIPKYMMPDFITEPLAMLKMLNNGERIGSVGKRYTDRLFYVYVDADVWQNFIDKAHKGEVT